MINLHFSNSKIFVWNSEDICTLRKEHRIVGSLVGYFPVKPFQVQAKWLPLQLMPEEAQLLIDKGICQLVSCPPKITDNSQIKLFYETRDKLCDEQISLITENRKKEILENADKIYEGKKRKHLESIEKTKKSKEAPQSENEDIREQPLGTENELKIVSDVENNSNLVSSNIEQLPNESDSVTSESAAQEFSIDKNALIEEEIAKVSDISKDMCLVQLFTESPWTSKPNVIGWNYPTSEKEKLKCAVFKDLWEKEYYVTSGLKFGGDFLAYEGDPFKFHAVFIIICMIPSQKIQGYDVVVFGRLGRQVKKNVALASLDDDGKVEYMTITWESQIMT